MSQSQAVRDFLTCSVHRSVLLSSLPEYAKSSKSQMQFDWKAFFSLNPGALTDCLWQNRGAGYNSRMVL